MPVGSVTVKKQPQHHGLLGASVVQTGKVCTGYWLYQTGRVILLFRRAEHSSPVVTNDPLCYMSPHCFAGYLGEQAHGIMLIKQQAGSPSCT